MTTSYRVSLIAANVAVALILSACQPTTETTEPTSADEVISPPIENTDTSVADEIENDVKNAEQAIENKTVDDDKNVNTDTDTDTEMLQDYTRSISRMHDEMMIGMGYNDPDTAFAKSMLGHHRGAIDMAQNQLKYGTDTQMRQLAQAIIEMQQDEMDTLRKWLASHPDAAKPKPDTNAVQQDYANDMADMLEDMTTGVANPVADMAFARGMLAHHKSAVNMALIQLKYGTDDDMRTLALQIIGSQQPQIKQLQNWITIHSIISDSDTLLNHTLLQDTAIEDTTIEDEAKKAEDATA